MIAVWLKALHVASLAIWCGGLLILPTLFVQRPKAPDQVELWHLQRFTRYAYVGFVSPAAFLAVATGTALVFVETVFTPWFAGKLLAVGVLALLHIRFAHVIVRLFKPEATYRPWRMVASILTALGAISAILVLVLLKPRFDFGALPDWALEPGGLQSVSPIMIPMP